MARHVMIDLDGRWIVRATGDRGAEGTFATEADAYAYARRLGHGVIFRHRRDGSVLEKVTL